MRATVTYGARDVRVEDVPDAVGTDVHTMKVGDIVVASARRRHFIS